MPHAAYCDALSLFAVCAVGHMEHLLAGMMHNKVLVQIPAKNGHRPLTAGLDLQHLLQDQGLCHSLGPYAQDASCCNTKICVSV